MDPIYRGEIQLLIKRITEKFVKWQISKASTPPKLEFKSYLNGYSNLCHSFDEIIGRDKVSDSTLRKLFYYSKNDESIKFRETTIDYFYLYFSGKTRDEYQSKAINSTLVVIVENTIENEFQFWRLDPHYFMDQSLLKKVLKIMNISLLDEEKIAFVIRNVVHYGESSLNALLCKNKNNKHVLQALYKIVEKGGNRDGWRAEYFLSKMNPMILMPFLDDVEKNENRSEILTKVERIKNQGVLTYLTELKTKRSSLSDFAGQVLSQLEKDIG